ncbi:uncharacterized protein LOC111247610 isoform X2 [Varroa destructor]|uniref:PH domain-containing protein n=1 Tax=Varroa destructor TaxID=109461 RepID=A0A7M7K256_VARDE|nr:uncharacterized protein LOC111247610 isoform X2 [Varroa destructor]
MYAGRKETRPSAAQLMKTTMSLQASLLPSAGQTPSSSGREIYRNGWLRCIPYLQTSDQLPKSHLENLFVSFCVHDDDGPWLEFYDNRHCSAEHKPVARFSLNECLHISPRLVCQEEDCFEFAVTLKDKVLRLATESRELTLDWVATLTEKLRERGVFRPKENEYTTEPYKAIPVAGVSTNSINAGHTIGGANTGSQLGPNNVVLLPPAHPRRNMPLPPPPTEEPNDRLFGNGGVRRGGDARSSSTSAGSGYRPPSEAEMQSTLLSMVESSSRFLRQESLESDASSNSSCASSGDHETAHVGVATLATPSGTPRDPTSPLPAPPSQNQPIYEPIFPLADRRLERNNHISRTESARVAGPRYRIAFLEDRSTKRHSYTGMVGFEDAINGNSNGISGVANTIAENRAAHAQLIQHDMSTGERIDGEGPPARGDFSRPLHNTNPLRNMSSLSAAERVMAQDTLYSDPTSGGDDDAMVGVDPVTSAASTSIVHRPLPNCDTMTHQQTITKCPTSSPLGDTPVPPEVPARTRHSIAEPRPLSPKPPRAVLRREVTQDNIHRTLAATPLDDSERPNQDNNNLYRQAHQAHERVHVRNSTVVPSPSLSDTLNTATHAEAPQIGEGLYVEISETSTGQVPLREAQILKLQEEMAHQAGMLVKFAKRELQGSLALVDVGGAVYIAGWNKPQMRTYLHIGDRLLNICGRRVICASEAHKTIKSLVINQIVELTIQRVPYGRALAMRRSFDGENLGLIMENGTNEIHRVLEGGLVHRSGLPLMVPTALDGGMTLTSWWITEVNHRPISLFYKNFEIEPRLRAVGKDISLVVQPSDFIRALKKQLKSMWTYKSYIVQ